MLRVVMMTNTYLPHVGGVARSVESFSDALRALGHEVMVVAPEFEGMDEGETGVVRVPAIQKFNGSDFSVRLPVPGLLTEPLDSFRPDIIHAHHPFLLGDTALRVASGRGLPLVFTHHTLYEEYTHYVSSDSDAIKRFVVDLSTGYANLCDHVIAPSQSVAALLKQRGVSTPITVVPTGVDVARFTRSAGGGVRDRRPELGIPAGAFVAGHIGRLAPEKNLMFLTRVVAAFLKARPEAWFLVAGTGPLEGEMKAHFGAEGVLDRVRFQGILKGGDLVDAYGCMDAFAFASQSETQGIVLAEAMAAGVPVVAVDANGVREVVQDGVNGRKLVLEDQDAFCAALDWIASLAPQERAILARNARKTAEGMSIAASTDRLAAVYGSVIKKKAAWDVPEEGVWESAMRSLKTEWHLLGNLAHAAGSAFSAPPATEAKAATTSATSPAVSDVSDAAEAEAMEGKPA